MELYTYTKKCHSQIPILEVEIARARKWTFLAASADKQTGNYDTEHSNHHLSQSP